MMNTNTFTPTETQRMVLKTYIKLMRAVSAVTKHLHAHLANYGLTISQFGVMEALYSLGPMYQKEISAKILKTDGNITMVLGNLAKRDLIARESNTADRRYINVKLTPKGRRLMDGIFPIHVERTENAFSCLSPEEIQTLGASMKKLGMHLTQANQHGLRR